MRTAVCTVMCSEPMIFAPASGCLPLYSFRSAIRPGISCSASLISFRPYSASDRSFTLKGSRSLETAKRSTELVSEVAGKSATLVILFESCAGVCACSGGQSKSCCFGFRIRDTIGRLGLAYCCGEKSRASCRLVRGKRSIRSCPKPRTLEQRGDVLGRKSPPDVSHILNQVFTIVRHHVDDQQAPSRLERSPRLGERYARFGDVMHDEEKKCCIE